MAIALKMQWNSDDPHSPISGKRGILKLQLEPTPLKSRKICPGFDGNHICDH